MFGPGLLARTRALLVVFPLSHVECVLRRARVLPVQDELPGVQGVARLRGRPTPVLELGALLGLKPDGAPSRLIVLRGQHGQLALQVDEVLGVYDLDDSVLADAPPLLASAPAHQAVALFTRDRELGLVLDAARLLSAEHHRALIEGAS